jgi:hypothetical protein
MLCWWNLQRTHRGSTKGQLVFELSKVVTKTWGHVRLLGY